jgi:hypothetical protein
MIFIAYLIVNRFMLAFIYPRMPLMSWFLIII